MRIRYNILIIIIIAIEIFLISVIAIDYVYTNIHEFVHPIENMCPYIPFPDEKLKGCMLPSIRYNDPIRQFETIWVRIQCICGNVESP